MTVKHFQKVSEPFQYKVEHLTIVINKVDFQAFCNVVLQLGKILFVLFREDEAGDSNSLGLCIQEEGENK
ncbi:hypothetical protein V5799_002549, partial [Amblyomma americanum]